MNKSKRAELSRQFDANLEIGAEAYAALQNARGEASLNVPCIFIIPVAIALPLWGFGALAVTMLAGAIATAIPSIRATATQKNYEKMVMRNTRPDTCPASWQNVNDNRLLIKTDKLLRRDAELNRKMPEPA